MLRVTLKCCIMTQAYLRKDYNHPKCVVDTNKRHQKFWLSEYNVLDYLLFIFLHIVFVRMHVLVCSIWEYVMMKLEDNWASAFKSLPVPESTISSTVNFAGRKLHVHEIK